MRKLLTENCRGKDARLKATNILLYWMSELFYRFALEEDFIEKIYYQQALRQGEEIFGSLLVAQAERSAKIEDEAPRGNLSYYILKGYHDGGFHIVSSRKNLKTDRDCLVDKDALCIRSETLLGHLRNQANFQTLTEKRMTKRLREEGALSDTKEKRSAAKKIGGRRYLELSFSALNIAARKY